MNPLTAVLLGIIQGLTEFLPISSTAHLTLAGQVLNLIDLDHPERWTAFIAVMQLGTVAAVIVYFRRELLAMVSAFLRDVASGALFRGFGAWNPHTKLAMLVVVGTLPVGILGFALKHVIEGSLTKSIPVIATSLIVLALLLWAAEKLARHLRSIDEVNWVDSLLIGLAQALALIPGSSRSGTTITAGLFLGLTRESAARFSFLLSIPAVVASGLYEMSKIHGEAFALGLGNLVIATVVSGVTGYAAIAWLLKYLMKRSTMAFVWYRILLGAVLLALLAAGIIAA